MAIDRRNPYLITELRRMQQQRNERNGSQIKQTMHQYRVERFMEKAGQEIPHDPTVPSEEVRLLRARLILEEALETIDALGFFVGIYTVPNTEVSAHPTLKSHSRGPSLELIADGCADISVVTIGTLSACGIADEPILREVDEANLRKFKIPVCPSHHREMVHRGEGHYACDEPQCQQRVEGGPYRRQDGKWVKPANFQGPDICQRLLEQMSDKQPQGNKASCDPVDQASDKRDSQYSGKFMEYSTGGGARTPLCNHCKGPLSGKTYRMLIDPNNRKAVFRCPNCMGILNSKEITFS